MKLREAKTREKYGCLACNCLCNTYNHVIHLVTDSMSGESSGPLCAAESVDVRDARSLDCVIRHEYQMALAIPRSATLAVGDQVGSSQLG